MSSNIDITQFLVEKLLLIGECVIKAEKEKQKAMKLDLSLSVYVLSQTIFFLVYFFTTDDETKYSESFFFLQLGTWVVYDLYIIIVERNYIFGKKNDLKFRESWGKIIDTIQNLIQFFYFLVVTYIQGEDSTVNKICFSFEVISLALNLFFLCRMIVKKKIQLGSPEKELEYRESGDVHFFVWVIVGQCFAVYLFVQLQIYGFGIPFLLLAGYFGEFAMLCFNLRYIAMKCKEYKTQPQKHKYLLMFCQGIALGGLSIYVSIAIGSYVICQFFMTCCEKKNQKPIQKQIPTDEN